MSTIDASRLAWYNKGEEFNTAMEIKYLDRATVVTIKKTPDNLKAVVMDDGNVVLYDRDNTDKLRSVTSLPIEFIKELARQYDVLKAS